MAMSLFQHGTIRTTEVKAKELRRFVERLITTARRGTLHARRRVISLLSDRAMIDDEGELLEQSVVQKLMGEIAPRYANRPGGYTRIIRLSDRRIGDGGSQVLLQLIEESQTSAGESASGESRRRRRAAKRRQAAEAAQQAAPAADGQDQAGQTQHDQQQ